MDKNKKLECYDCSAPYEGVDGISNKSQWLVDLLYNGKIVGTIRAPTRQEANKLRKRWYNGDK